MSVLSIEAYTEQRYASFRGKMLETLGIHGADEYPYKVVVGFCKAAQDLSLCHIPNPKVMVMRIHLLQLE